MAPEHEFRRLTGYEIPDLFGMCLVPEGTSWGAQAKEMLDHLEGVLASEPVETVKMVQIPSNMSVYTFHDQ